MPNHNKYNNFFDKEKIIEMYKTMSARDIAKRLNTKPQYVYRFLLYHNIPRRTKAEALIISHKEHPRKIIIQKGYYNYEHISKEMIENLYIKKNLTITQMSKELNGSSNTIVKLMKRFGIDKKVKTWNNNPNWKGGRMKERKRLLIYSPDHPRKINGNYAYEYVLLMEKKLGRFLEKNEVVHHIDGDETNNSLDNLTIMTRVEHSRMHTTMWQQKNGK